MNDDEYEAYLTYGSAPNVIVANPELKYESIDGEDDELMGWDPMKGKRTAKVYGYRTMQNGRCLENISKLATQDSSIFVWHSNWGSENGSQELGANSSFRQLMITLQTKVTIHFSLELPMTQVVVHMVFKKGQDDFAHVMDGLFELRVPGKFVSLAGDPPVHHVKMLKDFLNRIKETDWYPDNAFVSKMIGS